MDEKIIPTYIFPANQLKYFNFHSVLSNHHNNEQHQDGSSEKVVRISCLRNKEHGPDIHEMSIKLNQLTELSHPHVLRCYEVHENGGSLCFTT